MQMLGEDLVTVLDFLHIKYVIGLGEGAGANILLRFGMAHAARCLGLILVNVTAGKTSVMDYFKDKVCISSILFMNNYTVTDGHSYSPPPRKLNPLNCQFAFIPSNLIRRQIELGY
jgi:hypothetical protein